MEPLQQQKQPPQQPQPPHLTSLQQMDAREKQGKQMRDTQFLYTQKLVTQQTLLSATPGRPSGSCALGPVVRVPPAPAPVRAIEQSSTVNSEPEEEEGGLEEDEDEDGDDDVAEVSEKEGQATVKYFPTQKGVRQDPRGGPISGLLPAPGLQPHGQQAKEDRTKEASTAPPSGPAGRQPGWNLEEQLKQVSVSGVGVGVICSFEGVSENGVLDCQQAPHISVQQPRRELLKQLNGSDLSN